MGSIKLSDESVLRSKREGFIFYRINGTDGSLMRVDSKWVRYKRFPKFEERSDLAMPYGIDGGYLGLHLNFKVLTRYNDDMISDHAYDATIYPKAFSRL